MGKFSASWGELADELRAYELQSTTENGSSPTLSCAEEQNQERPFLVCMEAEELSPLVMEEEETIVENMPQPSLPLSLSPICESKNGELVLGDEWPSLPPRSSLKGVLPLPSLPPFGQKSGGGWMELFANNKKYSTNSSVVHLAISSEQRNTTKRMQPSPPLTLNLKQLNRDRMVLSQLLAKIGHNSIEKTPSQSPVQNEEVEEKLSQPLYSDKKRNINKKQAVQKTTRNPFSLLADMEKEDSTSQEMVKESPSIQISKRRKRRRSKILDKGGDQKQVSSFFITTLLLFIVPFLLVLLSSLKSNIYFW